MGFRVRPAAFGAPAVAALADEVAQAQGADPLAPVTVLVPTNSAGVLTRRALARRHGIANVQFLTAFRLAELLAGPRMAASGRRPLTTPVLAAAIRSLLAESPGRLGAVAAHEATVDAVRRTYRELRDLPQPALDRLAEAGPMAREAARLTAGVRGRLGSDWHDESDLVNDAIRTVELDPSVIGRRFGTVVVHLPERLTWSARRLLTVLSTATPVVLVPGLTGDAIADQDIRPLVDSLAGPVTWPSVPPPTAGVTVIDVSDADDEVRVAVRRVVAAAQSGIPLERIAVLWTTPDPYQRALAQALDAAGIPWNGTSPVRTAERLAGRALLGVLRVDRSGLRRRDVFAWLASCRPYTNSGVRAPVAEWERIGRDAGLDRMPWGDRLDARATNDDGRSAEARADGRVELAEAAERRAALTRSLAAFGEWVYEQLGPPTMVLAWTRHTERSRALLDTLLGPGRVRAGLPDAEIEAIERIEHALDRLDGLDTLAPPVTRAAFADALEAELDAVAARVGRIGTGVLVGPLGTAIGLDADLTIVLGAVEGLLPAPPPPDPFLSDADRRIAGDLPTSQSVIARQRRWLAAALRASPEVIIGVARGDLRQSANREVSRWLAELMPGVSPVTVHQPSFARGLVAVGFPATATEHRARALLHGIRPGAPIDGHDLVSTDPVLRRGVAMLRARRSARFTEFDGNLAGAGIPVPSSEDSVAPTTLETWARCPHQYLVRHVLRVAIPERLDEQLRMTPRDRGSLLHEVFDHFLQRVLAGELGIVQPSVPWTDRHRAVAHELLDDAADTYHQAGRTGAALLWRYDFGRLGRELDAWLVRDDARRSDVGLRPVASEQAFGRGESWPAAAVPLPDGRIVRFHGKIDRLDTDGQGRFHVTDYKTGSRSRTKLSQDDPIGSGTHLQLPVYAAAVAAHQGCSPIDIRSGFSFGGNRPDRVELVITPEVWEVFVRAVAVIVDGIAAGVFPPRPPAPGWAPFVECEVCDPDGLGTTEAYRDWQRKLGDPSLRPYLELVGLGETGGEA